MLQEFQSMIDSYVQSNNNAIPSINISFQNLCSKELILLLSNYKTVKGIFGKWLQSDCNITLNYQRKDIDLQLLAKNGKNCSFVNFSSFKWKSELDFPWTNICTSLKQNVLATTLVDLHSPQPPADDDTSGDDTTDGNRSTLNRQNKKVKYCSKLGYAKSSYGLKNKLLNAARSAIENILRNEYGMKANEDFRQFFTDCSRYYETEESKQADSSNIRELKAVENANITCNTLKTELSWQQKLSLCTQIKEGANEDAVSKPVAKALSSSDSQYCRLVHAVEHPMPRKRRCDAFDSEIISQWMHDGFIYGQRAKVVS
jgi:hypothetical protein